LIAVLTQIVKMIEPRKRARTIALRRSRMKMSMIRGE